MHTHMHTRILTHAHTHTQGGNRPMMADDSDEEFDPVGGPPVDSELDKVCVSEYTYL